MGQFVPYIRHADGSIVRVADAIYQSPCAELDPYLFEEQLSGFPESKVFWSKESGACLGVAPCDGNLSPVSNTSKPAI
jgi:hypothetical protein